MTKGLEGSDLSKAAANIKPRGKPTSERPPPVCTELGRRYKHTNPTMVANRIPSRNWDTSLIARLDKIPELTNGCEGKEEKVMSLKAAPFGIGLKDYRKQLAIAN